MNSAPFRTQSSPPTRAFGGAGGLSFAERAAAFRSTSEPTPATAAPVATATTARIMSTSTVATSVAIPSVTAPVATFEKAPRLSAAAQAAYVPKNARAADVKLLPTADMFPALPSKNSAAKTEPAVKSETGVKKPTFADIMKKRVEQDVIEAEIAERERLREQERKEREERDNRYYQIGTRGNSAAASTYSGDYEEEEVDQGYSGIYEENAFARPTGGYNPRDYGNYEEEMTPPAEDMGVPNDDEW